MTIQFDTFFPQKGFNKQFNIIENCEFEPNPRGVGFDADKIFWRKRDGITTDSNGNWDTTGDIKQMKEFSGDIILYTDNPEVYSFDGSNLSNLSISGIDYDSSKYNQIFNTSYLGGGRYPDDTTTYTINKYSSESYVFDGNNIYKYSPDGEELKKSNNYSFNSNAITFDYENEEVFFLDNSKYGDSGDKILYKLDLTKLGESGEIIDSYNLNGTRYTNGILGGVDINEPWLFFKDGNDSNKDKIVKIDTSSGISIDSADIINLTDDYSISGFPGDNSYFGFWADKVYSFIWSDGNDIFAFTEGQGLRWQQSFSRPYTYPQKTPDKKFLVLGSSYQNLVCINLDSTSFDKKFELDIGNKFYDFAFDKNQNINLVDVTGEFKKINYLDGTILDEKIILTTQTSIPLGDEITSIDINSLGEYYLVSGGDTMILDTTFEESKYFIGNYNIGSDSDDGYGGFHIIPKTGIISLVDNEINFQEDLIDDTGTVDPTAYIGKYVYINTKVEGGNNSSQHQWRQIRGVKEPTDPKYNKTLILDREFIIPTNKGDEVIFYNNMQNQQWFPQLRSSSDSDKLLARDSSGNTMFWNFPDAKKIVQYDGRIFKLPSNGKGVVPSYPSNYEIFDAQRAIEFYEEEILNIESFGGMIIVFFENKIGLISKTVINSDTGQYYYSYRDIIAIGPYSKNSYHLSDNGFYFFGRDKVLYSIGVEVDDTGKIQTFPNNIGMLLESYFDNFSGGEVFINYDFGRLWLIYKNSGQTDIFKYYNNYEGWIRDFYQIGNQFAETTIKYGNERFSMNNNQIVKWSKDVLTDLGNNFIQGLKVYGPEKGMMQVFNLTRIKIRLGFDGIRQIGGKTYVVVGANNKANVEGNIDNVKIISDINEYVSSNETMGSSLLGSQILGGDSEDSSNYDEIIDLTQNIGKTGQYYSIEIYNDEAKQMYFGGLITEYSSIIERSSVSFPSNYF